MRLSDEDIREIVTALRDPGPFGGSPGIAHDHEDVAQAFEELARLREENARHREILHIARGTLISQRIYLEETIRNAESAGKRDLAEHVLKGVREALGTIIGTVGTTPAPSAVTSPTEVGR